MLIQHPDRNSKKGAALIMVMLSGMLIVILGIGMLFFYQKQVERRMKLEFDIHRRLAAKSGFNLVQYSDARDVLKTNGVATYQYVTEANRPDILVTVGSPLPIYREGFTNLSHWVVQTNGDCAVNLIGQTFEFSTTSPNSGQRNDLFFSATTNEDVAWNNYPFGLCYDILFDRPPVGAGIPGVFPWASYVYVGLSNAWNQMFITNATVSMAVFGDDGDVTRRRLEWYEHTVNTIDSPTNNLLSVICDDDRQLNDTMELYMDDRHLSFGVMTDAGFVYKTAVTQVPEIFSDVTNVLVGVGGFTLGDATNRIFTLSKFEVRNPYEYEIYLSWTNRNRFLGSTGIFTNVLATVVDRTTVGNQYYFFDSFETVVP
jgi:hypothetical protein